MQNEIKSGIYCIENITTNKKYIGQSIDINDRWRKHISELNHNSHHNDYLQKAWNKYGEDDFTFYILEYCEEKYLDDKEIYYINLYNTTDRKHGYNLKSGGQFNCHLTEEIKSKISESNKKAYQNQELRDLRSANALKQWSNPEIKEKIMGSNNGMYGKHHTEESKQKMRDKKVGKRSFRRNTTPVFCEELNQRFDDATKAGKRLSLDGSAILKVCQGKRKTCGGYHWKFLNNRENNIS